MGFAGIDAVQDKISKFNGNGLFELKDKNEVFLPKQDPIAKEKITITDPNEVRA
jgi:hypothetical protein